MPPLSEAAKLTLNTDYPYDKVVFKRANTINVPAAVTLGDYTTVSFPHGLPFIPLCIGSYSTDNWANSYDFGGGGLTYSTTFAGYFNSPFGVVTSDATNITVTFANFSGSAAVYSYRVTALQPVTIPNNTSIQSSPVEFGLYMDSTENYLKIYDQNTVVINDPGTVGYDTVTVNHNLGYIPTVLAFSEWRGITGLYSAENAIIFNGITAYSRLSTTQLNFFFDPFAAGVFTIHYRIYLDAQN